MLRFLMRRLIAGLGTLLVSMVAMYLLVAFTMARARSAFADLDGSTAPNKAQMLEARMRLLDLETPVINRFFKWLWNFLQGDFGTAWRSGQPVNRLLQGAITSTLQLVTTSVVLAIIFGVAVGIVSALRQYSAFDYITIFMSFVLYSLPAFWVAVLLKQWGAIGFNDFLANPKLSYPTIAVIGALTGLLASLAAGGSPRRRVQVFGIGFIASAGALVYLQATNWWSKPNMGPVIILVTGVAIAFAATTLMAGLKNRRALFSALSAVGVGLALYKPLQTLFKQPFGWHYVLGLGLITILVGMAIGYAWGGPDRGVSARVASLVSLLVAGMIFVDKVMSVWGPYNKAPAIKGRPIPTIGDYTPNLGGNLWVRVLDQFTHLLLPTIALLLITFASYTRYSRATMLEVMSQDYIRTARAKGLPERTVIMRHAFRNTLIPIATIAPLDLIFLLGGAIITERVFARPGMGTLFIKSLTGGEIDPVMAYLVIVAAAAIVANIVADLLYALVDPRIKVNA